MLGRHIGKDHKYIVVEDLIGHKFGNNANNFESLIDQYLKLGYVINGPMYVAGERYIQSMVKPEAINTEREVK